MTEGQNGDQFAAVARHLRNEKGELETVDKAITLAVAAVRGCDFAGIALVGRHGRLDDAPATDDVARSADRWQRELGQGPCLDVLHGSELIVCRDLDREDRWPLWAPRVGPELGVRSMLSLRLFITRQPLGSLSLYSRRVDAFDLHDQATAVAFAAHLAVAVAATLDIARQGQAMLNRTVIGQAEGVLMERYGLSPEQAFTFLKRVSQDSNTKLVDVASELVRTRRTPSDADSFPTAGRARRTA